MIRSIPPLEYIRVDNYLTTISIRSCSICLFNCIYLFQTIPKLLYVVFPLFFFTIFNYHLSIFKRDSLDCTVTPVLHWKSVKRIIQIITSQSIEDCIWKQSIYFFLKYLLDNFHCTKIQLYKQVLFCTIEDTNLRFYL